MAVPFIKCPCGHRSRARGMYYHLQQEHDYKPDDAYTEVGRLLDLARKTESSIKGEHLPYWSEKSSYRNEYIEYHKGGK